jgi:hypothetical protein
MIRVCYYKGCGIVYGEKEPLSDNRTTHGLCPKHLKISLKEIQTEIRKEKRRNIIDSVGSHRQDFPGWAL